MTREEYRSNIVNDYFGSLSNALAKITAEVGQPVFDFVGTIALHNSQGNATARLEVTFTENTPQLKVIDRQSGSELDSLSAARLIAINQSDVLNKYAEMLFKNAASEDSCVSLIIEAMRKLK